MTRPPRFSLKELPLDEYALFKQVLLQGETSRNSLIQLSKWGTSKTDSIIRSLCDQQFLITQKEKLNSKGRSRYTYSVNPRLGYLIGAELNISYDRIVLADFNNTVIARKEYPASYQSPAVLATLKEHLTDFIKMNQLDRTVIQAIGIGLHGLIDEKKGVIHRILTLGQDVEISVKDYLENQFQMPIFTSLPRVLVLLKEKRFDLKKDGATIVNVNAGYGIGLGIFIDGKYHGGTSGMAGQIGHIIVPGNHKQCYCGNKGCLSTLLSYQGICEQVREKASQGLISKVDLSLLNGPCYEAGVEHIIDTALQNDKLCMNVLHEMAEILGSVLSNVVTLLNPDLLIVHSNLKRAGEIFMAPIRLTIQKNILEQSLSPLKIEFTSLDPFAVAEGGTVFALRQFVDSIHSTLSVNPNPDCAVNQI